MTKDVEDEFKEDNDGIERCYERKKDSFMPQGMK